MGEYWNNLAPLLDKIYLGILVIMAILLIICLIRAVIGPLFSDRIVAANMMGTMVMVMISVLALKLKEGYLLDICLLYALLSFLTVVVVSQTYLRAFLKRHIDKETGSFVNIGDKSVSEISETSCEAENSDIENSDTKNSGAELKKEEGKANGNN